MLQKGPRPAILLGLILLGLAAGSPAPPPAAGQMPSRIGPDDSPEARSLLWQRKVDPLLLAAPAEADQEVLVVLSEQADLSRAAELPTREEKGRFVFETLTELAARTQGPLVADLHTRGIPHRPFWIANAVLVTARRSLIEELARRPEIGRVERNPLVRMRAPPPEPVSPSSEAVPQEAQAIASGPEWNIVKVNAPSVWAKGFTGQGVVVAGQDTGYDWTHPALKGKYRGWNGSTANHNYNWHDAIHNAVSGNPCKSDAKAPCDDDGHGTETMGVMVGDDGAGNQIGMAPGAKWIGCRNMDEGTGSPATYMECFQFFLAPTDLNNANPDPSKAPDVINNSWSCPVGEGCTDQDVLKATVENVRAAGIAVVVAAGNSGNAGCATVNEAPEQYEASIDVGATDSTDAVASFSSRGPGENGSIKPQVVAPGAGIRSSVPGGGYGTDSGTSFSSPHAAGLTALVLSASPGLSGSVTGLEVLMEQTAVAKTTTQTCGGIAAGTVPNDTAGWGRIDALAAYNAAVAANSPPSVSITSPSNGTNFVAPATVAIQVSATDSDGTVARVDLFSNGTRIATLNKAPWTFSWSGVLEGNYSLTAMATDNRGASRTSAAVMITVGAGSLPAPWLQQDIGPVGLAGSASASAGVFAVKGSGLDIAGSSDQFHFVYQPLSGDGSIVARVASVQNTNTWAKAAVMIRETLAGGSRNAAMLLTPSGKLSFQWRPSTGGASSYALTTVTVPYWIKVTRTGNSFAGFISTNGTTWTALGSPVTIAMSSNALIGLAVTSHDNTKLCTGTFDNVSISGASWTNADVGAVGLAGSGSVSNGVFTVIGSGLDIAGASDQFHFLYRPLSGDGSIVARVASVQNTNTWAKAAVMIRETLAAGSTNAAMLLTPLGRLSFQWRLSTGAAASYTLTTVTVPYWVKVTRTGNSFAGFLSTNGTTWTPLGSPVTISMSSNALIGLAVTSHDNTKLCTATFDNLVEIDN